MKQFLLAHSADQPTEQLLASCIEQLGEIPEEASFGFLYISDALASQADTLLLSLKQATGVQHWVGSSGIALLTTNQEYYSEFAMVVMLADFAADDFRMLPNIEDSIEAIPAECREWCSANDFNVGLLHADPENPYVQPLIHQLGEMIPNSFLVGGISSSTTRHNIQFADNALHGGISGVVFSPAIRLLSNLTQGCTPIGPKHRITESSKNLAYRLDNKPALDVLTDDTGEVIARDWQQAANYIFAGLVNQQSDTDDYTVRQLIGVDTEQRRFAISDYLEQGQEIIFCRRDGNSALQDMQRMLQQLKSRLDSPIRGGIYISCLGRGRQQFGSNSEEVKLIHATLGEFPLAGFFANGEIHRSMLYGFTGVLTLFV